MTATILAADDPTTGAIDWEVLARASAHPTQVAALQLLAGAAELSPRDLAETLDAPLGVVSYHVRMLRDRGLIELARTEPRRGALQHYYRAAPEVHGG